MSGEATSDLTRLSREIVEAIRDKDAERLEQVLDSGFVHLSSDGGRQSKQEFVDTVTGATYTIDEIDFDSLRVECFDDVGVAAGVQRARGHLPDGTAFVSLGAFTDVFKLADGRWRLWLAHSVELEGE